jgi:hypothetical protein
MNCTSPRSRAEIGYPLTPTAVDEAGRLGHSDNWNLAPEETDDSGSRTERHRLSAPS